VLNWTSGYKFEALSLIPAAWDSVTREYIENRDQLVVNNAQQYCSVVQTGIGSTNLILGGEVDAGETAPHLSQFPMESNVSC
jgi:RAT1-interacting protein